MARRADQEQDSGKKPGGKPPQPPQARPRDTDPVNVFNLPNYSPELNPDELANADVKQAVSKQVPARTKMQLVNAASCRLRSVQR